MNAFGASPASWLLHTAVGGGTILFLAGVLMRWTGQPARRQRLGEIGLAAALVVAILSLGPPWLHVPVSWERASATPVRHASPDPPALAALHAPPVAVGGEGLEDDEADLGPVALPGPNSAIAPAVASPVPPADEWPTPQMLGVMVVAGFLGGSALLLGRWLLGHLALGRLLRDAGPAPDMVARLFAAMAGGRRPRLLVSRRLRVPISCGLWRPTVVLPARLSDRADLRILRWVFAHELTHLERRDAWSCWLFGLGQAVFYYLPWFWTLRRQVRLCQEFVADAAVTEREAGAPDYAEFLLTLSKRPALPVGATGVLGSGSDLFRRITMVLQEPVRMEKRCPHRWSLAAASSLLALAVLASGIGLGVPITPAAADEPTKDDIRVIVVPKAALKDEAGKVIRIQLGRQVDGGVIRVIKDIQVPAVEGVKVDRVIKVIRGSVIKGVQGDRVIRQIGVVQAQDPNKDASKTADPHVRKDILLKGDVRYDDITLGAGISDPHIDAAQVQKQVIRLREQLKNLPQVLNLEGLDNADLQKEIQKIMEQIKLQQLKLAKLQAAIQKQARATVGLRRPRTLGVQLTAPGAALADQLDLPKGQGLLVIVVVPGSPAARGGLKANDLLLEVAGKPLASTPALVGRILASLKPGAPFDVVVLRKGKRETLKGLTLPATRQPDVRQDALLIQPDAVRAGVRYLSRDNTAVLTTVMRTGDKFTTRYQEGSLIVTLTGAVADGKAKIGTIHVQDGGVQHRYESLDKVPEQYRDKVKSLIEMSAKGQVKVDIKKP